MSRREKKLAAKLQGNKPRPNEELDDRFLKTKMCKFHQSGICSKGAACEFAHTPEELHDRPALYRTTPCLSFSRRGVCKYGEACRYSHNSQDFPAHVDDPNLQDKISDAALYKESLSLLPLCLQNMLSEGGESASEKEHDDPTNLAPKHNLEEYWPPTVNSEANSRTATLPGTRSCFDVGTSSLGAKSGDVRTSEQVHTDRHSSDLPNRSRRWPKLATSLQDNKPRPNEELDDRFLKTKMCKFHHHGICRKGAACEFAHTSRELHDRPALYRTTPCLSMVRGGVCKYGEACKYSHNRQDFPEHVGDQHLQDKISDVALYKESLSLLPLCLQSLLSGGSESAAEKSHDDRIDEEPKHNLDEYWAHKIHKEADDYTATSQDTRSCSDGGTSSLDSDFGDAKTFEQVNEDVLERVTDSPAPFDLIVKNTFLHFGPSTNPIRLRRSSSADNIRT